MKNINKQGWAINSKLPYIGDQGHVDQVYFAAVEDAAEAIRQVRLASGNDEGTIIRPLTPSDLANHEMKADEVKNIVNYV